MRYRGNTTVALAAAVALVSFGLTACGDSSSGGAAKGGGGDILIGVPVPLSGDSASAGSDIVHGAELSAKKINDGEGSTAGRSK